MLLFPLLVIIIYATISPKIIVIFGITVGENIIATTKIRNNYVAIKSFIFPILR